MTDKIEIKSKDDWQSAIDLKDNADFMYFLSQLKAGSIIKCSIGQPELYCKIEIFKSEQEVFD